MACDDGSVRILLIEDDRRLADLLARRLRGEGHEAETSDNGVDGLARATSGGFDLAVVDVMLPGLDGVSLTSALREQGSELPVLMLTARDTVDDRVTGLRAGADDYLVKPFAFVELLARIDALARRSAPQAGADRTLSYGAVRLDPLARRVTVDDHEVELTAKEFDLLLHFARHPGRVFSREQLLDSVWGGAHAGYAHTVNSHINRLRAKIEADPGHPRYLKTVWGVGYRFAEDSELAG